MGKGRTAACSKRKDLQMVTIHIRRAVRFASCFGPLACDCSAGVEGEYKGLNNCLDYFGGFLVITIVCYTPKALFYLDPFFGYLSFLL